LNIVSRVYGGSISEGLRSPCTKEIVVFQDFSRVIRESSKHFVIMGTAPTGHTLLLLDAVVPIQAIKPVGIDKLRALT